jgi:thiopeptide-type bacteriocin biosynthesis protein
MSDGALKWSIKTFDEAVVRFPLLGACTSSANFASRDQLPSGHVGSGAAKSYDELLARRDVRVALQLASSSLASRLRGSAGLLDMDPKTRAAAYRYLSRMVNRCTPFGIMAGLYCCTIDDGYTRLSAREPNDVYVQLDGAVQAALIEMLVAKAVSAHDGDLQVRANPTLRYAAGDYTYVYKYNLKHETFTRRQQRSIRRSAPLEFIMRAARTWITIGALANAYKEAFTKDARSATGYVENLISEQLLRTNITHYPSCDVSLRQIITRASKLPSLRDYMPQLNRLSQAVGRFSLSHFVNRYEKTVSEIESTTEDLGLSRHNGNILNVILTGRVGGANVNRNTIAQITHTVEDLLPVLWSPARKYRDMYNQIVDTFGEGTCVEFATIVDQDYGIQIGPKRKSKSPVLAGAIAPELRNAQKEKIDWAEWDSWLLRKLVAGNNSERVIIDKVEIEKFAGGMPALKRPYLDSGAIFGTLLTEESDQKFHLKNIYGPSGTALLGRFTRASEEIHALCQRISAKEASYHPQAIIAEMLHISDPKVVNLASRRRIRDWELICGDCNSVLDASAVIDVRDLVVQAVNGIIKLYSKSRRKQVIVRMATAHNWGGFNDPAYSFLARLQHVGGGFRFRALESTPIQALKYIPRINYETTVLSLRRWRLDRSQLGPLSDGTSVRDALVAALTPRDGNKAPRYLTTSRGDQVLEFDLHDDVSLAALAVEVRRSGGEEVILMESWRECLSDERNVRHPNEFVIPIEISRLPQTHPSKKTVQHVRQAYANDVAVRAFMADAPWIYFELEIGESRADEFIVRKLLGHMSDLVSRDLIKRWFFVRYYREGRHHIRVRAEAARDTDVLRRELRRLFIRHFRSGLLRDVRECVYMPEMARYGGIAALDVCHDLFYAGTLAVGAALSVMAGDKEAEDLRWRFALAFLLMRIDTAFNEVWRRRDICGRVRDYYRREMADSSAVRKTVSERYRGIRPELHGVSASVCGERLMSIMSEEVRADYRKCIQRLRADVEDEVFEGIFISTIHMDCNRLFPYDERANEMMLYEFAVRYYRSEAALDAKKGGGAYVVMK